MTLSMTLLPIVLLIDFVLALPFSVISALFIAVAVRSVHVRLRVAALLLRDAITIDSDSASMAELLFSPVMIEMFFSALICAEVLDVPIDVNIAVVHWMCSNSMLPKSLLSARKLLQTMESSFMLPEPRLPIWKTSVCIVPLDSNEPLLQVDTIFSSGDDMSKRMFCFVFTVLSSTWLSPVRLMVSVPESNVVLSLAINVESPIASILYSPGV